MSITGAQPASNPNKVTVQPFAHASTDGVTKTYHGTSIVINGRVIGRITSWQPTAYSREGNHVYELNAQTWGRPVDYVPGKATGFTIAMVRTEVWRDELELAMGFASVFDDLMDQTLPFECYEYLFRNNQLDKEWLYSGCWFQERNEDAQTSDGDAMFRVNATLAYVYRTRVGGFGA
jgi:hypothetical protein